MRVTSYAVMTNPRSRSARLESAAAFSRACQLLRWVPRIGTSAPSFSHMKWNEPSTRVRNEVVKYEDAVFDTSMNTRRRGSRTRKIPKACGDWYEQSGQKVGMIVVTKWNTPSIPTSTEANTATSGWRLHSRISSPPRKSDRAICRRTGSMAIISGTRQLKRFSYRYWRIREISRDVPERPCLYW